MSARYKLVPRCAIRGIQESLVFLSTNDHSSSSSSVVDVASSGPGATKVVQKGGSSAPFFDPIRHSGPRDRKRAPQAMREARILGRRAESPRDELLDRHWESGSHDYGARRRDSDPSACHWGHVHRAPLAWLPQWGQ